MEHNHHNHSSHHRHHDHGHLADHKSDNSNFKLALSATLHCLLGCGIGEVAGMIVATWLGLSMTVSMILAVILGFIFGLGLGILPLLKKKFSIAKALKIVIIAEGLSILVMEFFEVLVQVKVPGAMEAGLTSGIFWIAMIAGLAAGFIAALPVNYIMIRKGVHHHH